MKTYYSIILLSLFIFASCGNHESDSSPVDSSPEMEETAHKIDSEQEEADSIIRPKEDLEYLSHDLKAIRNALSEQSQLLYPSINKRKIELLNGNGAAEYYSSDKQVQKIIFRQLTQELRRICTYYFRNDSLYFAKDEYESLTEKSKRSEMGASIIDSFFFKQGNLIRIINSEDCNAPYSEEYRAQEQKRLYQEIDLFKKRLRE